MSPPPFWTNSQLTGKFSGLYLRNETDLPLYNVDLLAQINPLTLSPLSSHSMASPGPELPDKTLYVTVFFRNFQADISALREFVTVGEAGFAALLGERVKVQWHQVVTFKSVQCHPGLTYIFTVRLHVMQRTVLLSQFCLSVCPSVRCVYCDKTKQRTANIFDTTRNGDHSSFLTPTVLGGRCPLPSEICAQNDPPPSKNADSDRFPLITSQP